jgi:hypothetical protein
MPRRVRLFPECHADTTLVAFLIKNKELYRHSAGSEVAGDMRKAAESGDFDVVVGIVDGDKSSKPRYFDLFEFQLEENNIQLWKKPDSDVYLIVIIGKNVGIETFVLDNARAVGVSLVTYGFETNAKKLGRKFFKTVAIETDPNYLQLLADLHTRQAPGFLTLERILNDFITT